MNGSSIATAVAAGRIGSGSSKKKNKSDGVFLKHQRQHLRRWRFARNARRAKRRKHREARSRRKYPWRWAYTTRRGRYVESGAGEPTRKSDQQYFYQRYLTSIQDRGGGFEGLVYRQGDNERPPILWPALSLVLCFFISMGIMALEVYEIGLGIVHGAASIVMAGLGILAKLPWIVLKYLLRKLDDYILTPPAMEERSKSKLHFHLYMFCLPFLPCWASVNCSKCKVWVEIPDGSSDTHSDDFYLLRCPRTECQEEIVKCRVCDYNFPLNDSEAMGRQKRSKDGQVKKKMKQHMQRNHKRGDDYVPTLPEYGQSDSLLGQASGMLCNASASFCEGFGCWGGSVHDEDEVDEVPDLVDRRTHPDEEDEEDQNDFSTLQADIADLNLESEATPGSEETSPDDLLDILGLLIESTVLEKEQEEAEAYFGQFRGTDLDPNTLGAEELAEEEDEADEEIHIHETGSSGGYSYPDFAFFDRRSADEKKFRPGSARRDRLCQNQIYFYQKYLLQRLNERDETGGFAGLVHRADLGNREDSSNPYYGMYVEWQKKVKIADDAGTKPQGTNPEDELRHMHRMLNLLLNLSDTQKQDLLEFHKGSMKLYNVGNIPNDVKLHYPTNWPDARAMLLEGAHSLMKNFPVPRVFEISGHEHGAVNTDCSHACVSLEEVIQIAAGHGVRFNFAYDSRKEDGEKLNNEGLNGTQAMWDLKKDIVKAMKAAGQSDEDIAQTNIGYIYFWSDAFLRCFIKQRDNSVWVLTVTICPPESVKSNGTNTFVLAMGRHGKNVDHTPVIEHYMEECQRLMSGFDCYFGDTNQIGRMAVGMLSWSADRPERQSISNTRQEGLYGKVTGWAAKVSEGKFPACRSCYRRRVLEMIGGTEVEEGETAGCQCNQCLDWTLDPNEGNEQQKTDKPSQDYPKESDDERMMNDAPPGRLPGQGLLGPIKQRTEWMMKALKTAYNGMRNQRWSKKTTEAYLQSCNVGGATVDKVTEVAKADLKNKTQSKPEKYTPKFWTLVDCFSRFRLPDLPMHGLAHGIIPDVMDVIHTILKNFKKGGHFCAFANRTTMEDVASFRLDWCKVKSLPKAAWVGENTMAYMRLMSYMYGMYFSSNKLSSSETEKTRQIVSSLKRVINALQALMSVLMSRAKPDERTTDNHMKLFMSTADSLHKAYGPLSKKPTGQKDRIVDVLSAQELIRILNEFGVSERSLEDATPAALKNQVDRIVVAVLKTKCGEFSLRTDGLKPALQKRVFEHILEKSIVEESQTQCQTGTAGDNDDETGSDVGNEDQEEGENDGTRPNDKRMCWNKGNWLSFLTNISAQMKYLGPLDLIW